MTTPPTRTRSDAWLVAILWAAIAMCVRAWWISKQPPVPLWDGAIYHRTAIRISQGLGFVDTWNNRPPFRPTAFYPVGYPAVLGGAYAILGVHRWVAGLLNVLSAGIAGGLVVRLADRAWGSAPSHIAGALFAFAPGAVIYTAAFMTEPLSAAILAMAVTAGTHHARTGRMWSAGLAGLALGAGGLVRPPALLIAPVLALACVPRYSVRAALTTLAIVGIAASLIVLPWSARNCVRLDGCALVSVNGGSNLWIGTDPDAHGDYRDLRPREGCDGVAGEVAKDRCYARLALHRIATAPLRWLTLAPLKLRALLAYEMTPVSYLRAATSGPPAPVLGDTWYRILTAWHRAVLGLALVALVPLGRAGRHQPREVAVVAMVIAALIVVHVVFFGVDRYHFVFTPLVCMIASGAFRRVDVPGAT